MGPGGRVGPVSGDLTPVAVYPAFQQQGQGGETSMSTAGRPQIVRRMSTAGFGMGVGGGAAAGAASYGVRTSGRKSV